MAGSADNISASKTSSNKRSHHHVRKNARPTRARVASKRQASNPLPGNITEGFNNNSDEEVVELVQPTSLANPTPFNSLPPPAKRLSLLATSNFAGPGVEGESNDTQIIHNN